MLRDKELAKFEAFLNKEECMNINALTRGRSRMAYPIKKCVMDAAVPSCAIIMGAWPLLAARALLAVKRHAA